MPENVLSTDALAALVAALKANPALLAAAGLSVAAPPVAAGNGKALPPPAFYVAHRCALCGKTTNLPILDGAATPAQAFDTRAPFPLPLPPVAAAATSVTAGTPSAPAALPTALAAAGSAAAQLPHGSKPSDAQIAGLGLSDPGA